MTSETRILAMLFCAAALGCAAPVQSRAASTAPGAPQTLTLAQARALALERHPRIQIAELSAQIAHESFLGARAAYLPEADAYADAVRAASNNTRILAGSLNNPVIYDRTADGIAIRQLITDFGRTSNLIASARLSEKAERENSDATRAQTVLNVDAAYYRTLQAQAVAQVARATVTANDTIVRQVNALAQNRLKSDLDVSFSEVGLEQSRLLLQRAEGDLAGSRAALASALGYRESPSFQLEEPSTSVEDVSVTADQAVEQALQNRPDLLRLNFQRDAARRQARAEKDRNYPVVAAVGTAGNAITHDNRLPNRYAAGGITLDIPLFAGGAYAARERTAELRAQSADQELRDAEDIISRDVRLAWISLSTAKQRARTTALLVKHAHEAYALAQARYRVGSSSIVEFNQAQLNATQAEIADAEARYDALIAVSLLDYQMGTLRGP